MRFLQTEWHRHERDRNSWEIERAEMKARIAKLEGENRASKRLQQGSEARIKMLEMALKRERCVRPPIRPAASYWAHQIEFGWRVSPGGMLTVLNPSQR